MVAYLPLIINFPLINQALQQLKSNSELTPFYGSALDRESFLNSLGSFRIVPYSPNYNCFPRTSSITLKCDPNEPGKGNIPRFAEGTPLFYVNINLSFFFLFVFVLMQVASTKT